MAKTVNVLNGTGRPLVLHLHQVVKDDGADRPFFGRLLETEEGFPNVVQLRPGHNSGVHEEFFTRWREQNKGFGLLPLIVAEDEDEPESAKREE